MSSDDIVLNEQLITEIIAPPINKPKSYLRYERTIINFLNENAGKVLMCTPDKNFIGFVRKTLVSHLHAGWKSLFVIHNRKDIVSDLRREHAQGHQVVLMVENEYLQKNLGELVGQIKDACESAKLIILTGEADVSRIALLHETGADNFIVPPISTNSLITKLAFTIRPHGKISKLIDRGKRFLGHEKFGETIELAAKVLELKPDSAAAYMLMGDALRGMAKADRALEAYENACSCAAMYMEPLKKLAELHKEEGNSEEQLKYLEKLNELSPLNVPRKVEIGTIHLDLGHRKEADGCFEDALDHMKREAAVQVVETASAIADAYMKRFPAKAETYYREAINAAANAGLAQVETYNRLGASLRKQGRWQDSLTEYRKALEIAPDDEVLYYNIALAYSDGARTEDAYENIRKVLSMDAEFFMRSHVVAFNFALIAKSNGNYEKAKAYLKASLSQNPDYAKAQAMLKELSQ